MGTVVSIKSDTLEIAPDDLKVTLFVLFQNITILEKMNGKKSRVGNGALIGFGTGAAIGITVGAVLGGGFGGSCGVHGDDDGPTGCGAQVAAVGGIGLGLIGVVIGALVGTAAGPGEVWEEVQLDNVKKAHR